MTNKELATFAEEKGLDYIYTIVKSHFNSRYYNVNSVSEVKRTGKFSPAPFYNGYRHGIITSELPKNGMSRTLLRYLYEEENKKGVE